MSDRRCRTCGEPLSQENTFPKSPYLCKPCDVARNRIRRQESKTELVETMGGKCAICGYSRYAGALHFHHIDPSLKHKKFANLRAWSRERQLKELENCVLLCSNCHIEVENGITTLSR